jgi:hypothetical protein
MALVGRYLFNGLNKIQYIRDSINGSTSNTSNHWVEIQAYDANNTNIALNKSGVTSSAGWSSLLTDGTTTTTPYYDAGSGNRFVIVNLGGIYDISYVKIYHYYGDGRTYHNNKTEVSPDGHTWYTIFDSNIDGEYAETSAGHTIPVPNCIFHSGDNCIHVLPSKVKPIYSIAFWFKLKTGYTGSYRKFLQQSSDRSPGFWARPNDNRLHLRQVLSITSNAGADTTTELNIAEWYHIVYMCYSDDVGTGTKIQTYVNGVLDTDAHYPNEKPVITGDNIELLPMDYDMYDLRIYDHPLSMKEIKELSKSKTLHYTFNQFQEPTVNLISNHLINTTDIKNGYNGWLTIGTGNDTRKFIHNSNVPVNPNNIYTFSCIYYSSGNIGDGDVYLRFDGTGYSEGNVYLQPLINTPHHISYNTINLGGGFYYREGTFTTTSDTNNITQIFYDSDVSGIEIFIANLQLEAKDHATPFVDGVRKGNVGDCAGINNTDLGKLSDKNILDPSTWVVGTYGSQTGFSQNGDGNSIIVDNGPHFKLIPIWRGLGNDTASDADGGWNTSSFSIDNTSTYRFSVWINRVTKGNGHVYFGCHGYGSTNGVIRLSDSTNNTNPYFNVQDVGEYDADLNYNTWYLFVGHVLPSNHTGTTNHVLSGIYDIHGNKVVAAENDYKWRAETTTADHRTYLFYSTDPSTEVRWAYPRVDKCDGTHPSVQELIAGLDIRKSPKWVEGGPIGNGYYEFDGINDYIESSLSLNSNKSISCWVKWNDYGSASTQFIVSLGTEIFELYFHSLSTNSATVLIGNGSSYHFKNYANVAENEWIHLVAVDNGNTIELYKNGIKLTPANTTNTYIRSNSNIINIGRRPSNQYYFNGSISDVRIYSTALSADDIREIYQSKASIDKNGNFYVNMFNSPATHVLIKNEQSKNVYDSNGSMGTWTLDDTDVSNFVEEDNTLGNTLIDMWVYCSSVDYYLTGFEYTKENNTKGFAFTVPPEDIVNRSGWGVGWHHIITSPSGYVDAANTPWSDMTRFETYRSGPTTGSDTSQYIKIKDLKFVKYLDNSQPTRLSFTKNQNVYSYSYSEVGPTNGLVLYMPLNGDTKDYSGNKNDGTNNGATVVQGLGNKLAYSFDTSNSYTTYEYIMTNNTTIMSLTKFTYSVWCKTTDDSAFLIIGTRYGNNTYQSMAIINSKLCLHKYIYNNNSDGNFAVSSTSIDDGNWHLLTITYNEGLTKTYVDAIHEATETHVNTSYSNVNFQINYDSSLSDTVKNRNFGGLLQDVRIYNRALSQQEISWLFDMYNPNKNIGAKIFNNNIIYTHSFKEGY